MSRRSNSRLIRVEDESVFVADLRPQEVEIPVFSFSGIVRESTSPPWFPSEDIILYKWYAAAGDVGSTSSYLRLLIGDNSFDLEGTQWASMYLGASELRREQGITSAGPRYANVAKNRQWIKVDCGTAGGHRDLTIKIFGRKA